MNVEQTRMNVTCEQCEHCLYVGEGGFWCDEHEKMIADDFDFSNAVTCNKYDEKCW